MTSSFHYAGNTLACIGIGIVLLCVGIWLSGDRMVFLLGASNTDGLIVNVAYEDIPQGRGSIKGYVPTIELTNTSGAPVNVKVDTYNQDPVYIVGTKMAVLCNSTGSQIVCRGNSVIGYSMWPIALFVIGLVFLWVGRRRRRLHLRFPNRRFIR